MRRNPKGRAHRITPEAVAAFEAGDYTALHRALGLKPWQPSPLPLSVTPLGADPQDPAEQDGTLCAASWPLAVELQRELFKAGAKMPTRTDPAERHAARAGHEDAD